jgi:hypothetical protein
LREFISRHSFPVKIVSDRGREFIAKGVQHMWQRMNVMRPLSSIAHPESNTAPERFNRFLSESLYTLVNTKQNDWDERVWETLFAYRTSVCPTTGETPYFLVYGRDPVLPDDLVFASPLSNSALSLSTTEDPVTAYATEITERLRRAYEFVSARLRQFAQKWGERYSLWRKAPPALKAGDRVLVVHKEAHKKGSSTKFASRASGPFTVVAPVSESTWRLCHQLTGYEWVVNVNRILPFAAGAYSGPTQPPYPETTLPEEAMENESESEPGSPPSQDPPLVPTSEDQEGSQDHNTMCIGSGKDTASCPVSHSVKQARSRSGILRTYNDDQEWVVESLLDRRKNGNQWEWLIDWAGDWEPSWHPLSIFQTGSEATRKLWRQFEKAHPYPRRVKSCPKL